jgi:hypothetical protein
MELSKNLIQSWYLYLPWQAIELILNLLIGHLFIPLWWVKNAKGIPITLVLHPIASRRFEGLTLRQG